jgi:vacuolar-type H+-ATPase subunit H
MDARTVTPAWRRTFLLMRRLLAADPLWVASADTDLLRRHGLPFSKGDAMSVFEPHTTATSATGIEIDLPDFPIVVRGYDRHQVNAYVQSIVSRLAAERDRATQAEQAAANDEPPTFEHLGAEAMKVLKLAGQSGEALVEQAKKHGETIVQEAEGQAADVLEKAKQQAERLHAAALGTLREAADERDRILTEAREQGEEIRTLAEDDARSTLEEAQSASERMWQTVNDECTAMQAETKRLRELRDRMMEHLTYVRTELNSSLFIQPQEEEADLTPVRDATVEEVSDGAEEASDGADASATANAEAESAASPDAAEPDSALVVQDESDEGGSEARPAAAASARGRPKPRA